MMDFFYSGRVFDSFILYFFWRKMIIKADFLVDINIQNS